MHRLKVLFRDCPLEQALDSKTETSKQLSEGMAEMVKTAGRLVPVRRTHPDDTCPGERRHNHLRGVPK